MYYNKTNILIIYIYKTTEELNYFMVKKIVQ